MKNNTKKRPPQLKASIAVVCFLLLSACATAASILYPVNENAAKARAGNYEVDPNHASVLFAINHFGFSVFRGRFDTVSGALNLDTDMPENSSVTADVLVNSLHTGVSALDPQILDKAMFDAERHNTANFTSTFVHQTNENSAFIDGILTIKGVRKPITLNAHFIGSGTNPLTGKRTVGFSATTKILRSEFGLKEWLPFVGDEVDIAIDVEFVEQ